jgi:hypothetical protein
MTEIKDLTTLDPVDTSYFVPVQGATGETAKLPLSAIGGGGTSWVQVPSDGVPVVVTGSAKYLVYGTGDFTLPAAPAIGTEVMINNLIVASADITLLTQNLDVEGIFATSVVIPIGGAKGIYSLIYNGNSWYFGFGTMTINSPPIEL